MGALCGKESRDDNFAGPGRRLDSSPDQSATAPLPSNKRVVGGPPRTLGGSSTASAGGGSAADAADARRMAAAAAEERHKKAGKGGKLHNQLQQLKGQTDNQIMVSSAEQERQQKQIDQDREHLSYN